jgi:hypothetical protein
MFFKSWRPPEGVTIAGKIDSDIDASQPSVTEGRFNLKRWGSQPNNAEQLLKHIKCTESIHNKPGKKRMPGPQQPPGPPPSHLANPKIRHQPCRGAPNCEALAMRGSVNSGSGLEPKPMWGPKYRASGSRPANGGQQQLSEVLTPLDSDLDSTDVIEVCAPTMPRDWGGHQMGDSSTLQQCRNIGLRDVAGLPAVGGDGGDLDMLRKIVESSVFKFSDNVGAKESKIYHSRFGWVKAHPHFI